MIVENNQRITIALGDGIGPEITDATMRILKAANARLDYDVIEVGEKQYLPVITAASVMRHGLH